MSAAYRPAIVHITHWKAGSQWLHKILNWCAPGRVVAPSADADRYLPRHLERGMIYATAYVTKDEFNDSQPADDTRYFVMLRDLRDTLVSLYFSARDSHQLSNPSELDFREALRSVPQEDGLLLLANHPTFKKSISIHRSWLATGIPILKYEDLLEDDEAILEEVLLSHCRLGVSREHLLNAVRGCRFESLTGRPRGKEDIGAHERKGIAGDWKNHFTPRIARNFEQYDDVLTAYSKAPMLSVCCAGFRSNLRPQTRSGHSGGHGDENNLYTGGAGHMDEIDHLENAKSVLRLTLEERRRWLNAYANHHALDVAALAHIATLQGAVDAAEKAVSDETVRSR